MKRNKRVWRIILSLPATPSSPDSHKDFLYSCAPVPNESEQFYRNIGDYSNEETKKII